jgi:hypothetical protein
VLIEPPLLLPIEIIIAKEKIDQLESEILNDVASIDEDII